MIAGAINARLQEESLGAQLDEIRFRPEFAGRTLEQMMQVPEFADLYRDWEAAFAESIALNGRA